MGLAFAALARSRSGSTSAFSFIVDTVMAKRLLPAAGRYRPGPAPLDSRIASIPAPGSGSRNPRRATGQPPSSDALSRILWCGPSCASHERDELAICFRARLGWILPSRSANDWPPRSLHPSSEIAMIEAENVSNTRGLSASRREAKRMVPRHPAESPEAVA